MSYQREVFANAPLAYVACEVRFPLAPSLTGEDSLMSFATAFADTLPIPEVATFLPSPDMDAGEGPERQLRFLDKARTASVAVTRRSVSVEVTHYDGWDHFKPRVLQAIEATTGIAPIVGVERIGLRYINEIRVPDEVADASGWKGWIAEGVVSHLEPIPGYTAESSQTVIDLRGEGGRMVARYAALVGSGVVSDEPLRRKTPATVGPFFVIDTDSYRETPGEEMLACTSEALDPVLDELHEPLGELFQRTITDKSRNLFRGGI